MLSLIILLPLINILLILILPEKNIIFVRQITLTVSFFNFILSLFLWIFFDCSCGKFQFIEYFDWIVFFNINFFLGIDGVSLFFLLLTTFLTLLCVLASWSNIKIQLKKYYICLLLIEFFLIVVFSVLDILVFYIFFESILIPMFLIIGVWGARTRKLKAAYQFFLYTLFGSLFMLLGILYIFFETGFTDFQLLNAITFPLEKEIFLWLSFFLSFSVKVPMFPLHIWLPEAHTEAPTAGSVILAGILLKMGTYGLLRFSICLFPTASIFFSPIIFLLSIISIIYVSLTTIRQVDLKKIIAYSSVAHMAFVTMGVYSFNFYSFEGSLIIMISHGFISSGLFFCVGFIYDQHHTRFIKYYTGLVQTMPVYSFFFLFFTIANLGFPGASSFAGEFLTLAGIFQFNTTAAFLGSFGMVLGAAYSLWLCNRILFGSLNLYYINIYKDLNRREFATIFPLFLCVIWLGIYPEIFLEPMHFTISNLLNK
jgi:proton-translocating NADH-quinone oxidoreductase chain M